MNKILALANVVIKELYRRKDFYVLLFFTVVIVVVMGAANFFHEEKIVRFLKEVCLLLIWLSALFIAVGTAARQIPAERENRTIFPLLAKPVTRAHVVLGKFLGCWFACGIALLVFYAFFEVLTASREHQWFVLNYLEALWLQWMFLAVVIAMVLFGSIVFAAPSSNATICVLFVICVLFLGRYLGQVSQHYKEPLQSLVYSFYFLIPHLEWSDIREMVVHERQLVPWWAMGLASLYFLAYTAFFLLATWILFRRKALTT